MNTPAKYRYVIDLIENQLLSGHWQTGQKIPSIRWLTLEWHVHVNTVLRACRDLQQRELISSKRGIGLFVAPRAIEKIKAYRKERFIRQDLPDLFKNIYLLDLDPEDIWQRYSCFVSDSKEN
jgi:DNA-binding transcriptional regulator YhcF (GntR family)